jgi:hypothetical protein
MVARRRQQNIMNPPVEWLLEGDPWIAYRTRVDLLGQPEMDGDVQSSRQLMLEDPKIRAVLHDLMGWPGVVISSHKSANQPFHKLTFMADLGLRADDPAMENIIPQILKHQSPEGPFQLPMNIPTQYGGSGKDQWAWALCDAPLVVYALIKFGLEKEPGVQSAPEYLMRLVRDNGWPCAVSKELGKFRGPGCRDDPCPLANLAMLKVLSVSTNWKDSQSSHIGAETLLSLWSESTKRHPYMFFMGTDFRKLKVPLVWYDLLHVLDVLSCFPWLTQDTRLRDMVTVLKGKADQQGCFTSESIWTFWKDWEFGQKREPSRWLTLLAWRIIRRVEAA